MTAPQQIAIPAGLVVCTTYGSIRGETAQALMEMRSHAEKNGLTNVGWAMIPGTLVEKARNDAVRTMLGAFEGQAQWLLFVDGDMTFAPDSLQRMLVTAFGTHPWADVLGAYCTLKGELGLPTIDTGSGTWESVYPNRGVVEVIRTGAAFLLCKRQVFERIRDPWFRVRQQMRWLDALAEIDNLARIKMDGSNPFRNLPGRPWEVLEEIAASDPSAVQHTPTEVGEDSGFCDRVKNAGLRIAVDTNIQVGHIETVVRDWRTHKERMAEMEQQWLQAVGVS